MPGDGFILIFWSWLFGLLSIVWFTFEPDKRKSTLIATGILAFGIAGYFSIGRWDEDHEWANQIRAIAIVTWHVGIGGFVGTAISALIRMLRAK